MTHEEFLHHFEQVRGRTMNLARCIPADKVEWSARDGGFTLGGLARHIAATERLVFAEGACGRPSRYAGCGPELARRPRSNPHLHGNDARRVHGDFPRVHRSPVERKREVPRRPRNHRLETTT